MGYDKVHVAALLKDGGGCDEVSIRAIGMADGGSVESQHRAAVQFWTLALALEGGQELTDAQKAVAERELVRHQAAVAAIGWPPPGPDHPQVV